MTKSTTKKTTRKSADLEAGWELFPLIPESFTDEQEIQKLTDQFYAEILPLADEIKRRGKRKLDVVFTSEEGLAAAKEWLTTVRTVGKAPEPAK